MVTTQGMIQFILMLGAVVAAGAVLVLCGIGLVVWLAGNDRNPQE